MSVFLISHLNCSEQFIVPCYYFGSALIRPCYLSTIKQMAMETTQAIVYIECDLTQFIVTQKEHDRLPCLDSFALCENRSGNKSLRLLWLKFRTVHCYQSCFKNPHFLHTRLIMDLMRSLVNHWSPLTHTSHCMTTSRPAAATQMRARVNPAILCVSS